MSRNDSSTSLDSTVSQAGSVSDKTSELSPPSPQNKTDGNDQSTDSKNVGTADQKAKSDLEKYEKMFANRYTDDDPDYANTTLDSPPPVIFPWFGRNRRNNNYGRPRSPPKRRFEEPRDYQSHDHNPKKQRQY